MNLNSRKLATHVLDVMHSLPPTNPLSLSNTNVRQASKSSQNHADSKPTELPPFHGFDFDASLLEAYNQVIDKLFKIQERLRNYKELSCQIEERISSVEPVDNLPKMLEDIQEEMNNVRNLEWKIENIEKASKDIQKASERLSSLTMSEGISRLNTVQEMLQNSCTRL